MFTITVAKDFSSFPSGRYITDGEFSGECFKINHLIPALQTGEKVCVNLDGGFGYGSNFLDEAFGGLVRDGYSSDHLLKTFSFISNDDPFLVHEILSYIKS